MRTLLPLALALALASPTLAPAQQGVGPGRGGAGGVRGCEGKTPPAEQEPDDVVYPVSELTCKAVLTSRPEPQMTPQARRHNVQGTVRLRVTLLASGKVGNVQVVRGLPEGLSEQAVKAARRIKFRPAEKDGRRVSQSVLLEYNFNIY